jgi:chemotaxis protein MotA
MYLSISEKIITVNERENIMLRDLALAAKAACSQEDQESLVSIVRILKDLGDKVKKRGILSLEEEQSSIEDRFFRIGLQLIIDQSAPEIVRDILDSDIYYNESNGRELLKKIIIREGLLHIQAGDTARNILLCTRIFLGKVDIATFDRLYGEL